MKKSRPLKLLFFGTSSFAAAILEFLIDHSYPLVGIVTRPDQLKGRHLRLEPPPVKEVAQRRCPDIPLFQPQKASDPAFIETIRPLCADLFIVVAYGEIIKQQLLDVPKYGCVNIHASLLPAFRGAAPMQRALMAGVSETGITLIAMTPAMDAGDVLAIESLPVPFEMNCGELEEKLRALSMKLLQQVLEQYASEGVVCVAQNHSLATLAPKLVAGEEKIEWTRSAFQIHNQIRALSPIPGAWCFIQVGDGQKRLKIKRSRVVAGVSSPPGTLFFSSQEGWQVACAEGCIALEEVQLEGKRVMPAGDCLRGFRPLPERLY